MAKPGHFSGPQASFAGCEFIAVNVLSNKKGLYDSLLFDRAGQLLQLIIGKPEAGLETIWADQLNIALKIFL